MTSVPHLPDARFQEKGLVLPQAERLQPWFGSMRNRRAEALLINVRPLTLRMASAMRQGSITAQTHFWI
jgi:hypothetical protein